MAEVTDAAWDPAAVVPTAMVVGGHTLAVALARKDMAEGVIIMADFVAAMAVMVTVDMAMVPQLDSAFTAHPGHTGPRTTRPFAIPRGVPAIHLPTPIMVARVSQSASDTSAEDGAVLAVVKPVYSADLN
jgi:hypothetical protein